ncbi:MAG TPA: hypothetical protein VEP49_06130 [Acidimicrobiia bacterium]|nr:hypothetical protein [Acidimicrobiia bacterium]
MGSNPTPSAELNSHDLDLAVASERRDGEVMLSIGDFARSGRVSPRTLRHYGPDAAIDRMCAAYDDWPGDDGRVLVHQGFDIGDQEFANDAEASSR